jgi:hypothetical protein
MASSKRADHAVATFTQVSGARRPFQPTASEDGTWHRQIGPHPLIDPEGHAHREDHMIGCCEEIMLSAKTPRKVPSRVLARSNLWGRDFDFQEGAEPCANQMKTLERAKLLYHRDCLG